jgi:hypothetical protein
MGSSISNNGKINFWLLLIPLINENLDCP